MRERRNIIKIYTYHKCIKRLNKTESIKRTGNRLLISNRCVRKYVDLWINRNTLHSLHEQYAITHGRKRQYTKEDLLELQNIIVENNALYLDEIQVQMIKNRMEYFSISKIVRMIDKLQITRKKISKIGIHFNYNNVRLYQLIMKLHGIRKNQLIFTDESYCHDRIANRRYGRSLRCDQYNLYM